jgi:hypothetical protein
MPTPTCIAAIEYGEGCAHGFVLNTPRGIAHAGYCYACDLGYEGDECTCTTQRITVRLYNQPTPAQNTMASPEARARGILLSASGARHNLEPDQVSALNDLLAPTGTTLDALLSEQRPHYTDPAFACAGSDAGLVAG